MQDTMGVVSGDAQLDELLAAVYADPRDDVPRMVLADALQQRGDPRGEFIALQLRRVDVARQCELIAANDDNWLGGLAGVVMPGRRRYNRGFLVSCPIDRLRAEQLEALARCPEWATLERVEFYARFSYSPTLISSHMRSVRALIGVCEQGLEQLCRRHADLAIEELAVASTRYMDYVPTRAAELLAACKGLERLRTLHVEFAYQRLWTSVLEPLWGSRVGERLETLVINDASRNDWIDWQLPVRYLAVRTLDGWRRIEPSTLRCWCREDKPGLPIFWLTEAHKRGYCHAIVEVIDGDVARVEAEAEQRRRSGLVLPELEFRAVSKDDPLPWEVVPEGVICPPEWRRSSASS
jgi:uncharacterized protein (TIGR02996 family)